MNGWLKKAWHDPVGSKVIAGIILGPIGLLAGWLWSASDFSTNRRFAWTAARAAIVALVEWFAVPVPLSRAWLCIIISLDVIGWCFAAILVLYDIRRQLDAVRSSVTTVGVVQPTAAPVQLPPPEAFSEVERHLFWVLYREYPRAIDVRIVAAPLALQYPKAEKLCEELAKTGLITLTPGAHHPPSVYLTPLGRDYVLEHGLDHQQ
jgi:hypothetical protein